MSRLAMRLAALAAGLGAVAFAAPARAENFTYNPPGVLVAGSGEGRVDDKVYAPGMRFPIESAPAFANSQVWGVGGSQGPAGSQCAEPNYSYPWSDNYCETRSWDMPLCPSGTGHQGQDIRGATCDKLVHWVVASEAGTVTNVGSYSVYITAADGTRYDYLHMGNVQVAVGASVAKGQRVGQVSNEFGGTPTSVHLHFNLRQNVTNLGNVYVPTYMSLVTSYQELLGPMGEPPAGTLDEVGCEVGMRGWAFAPTTPDVAIEARVFFDGEPGDGATVGHPVLADQPREDLCNALGSCDHAFTSGLPLSLLDGATHTVRAYAADGTSQLPEMTGSPASFACELALPSGVRRSVPDLETKNAWRLSTFWDEIAVSDGVLSTFDEAEPLEPAPRLVASDASPEALWLVDRGERRAVGDVLVARAWEFAVGSAESIPDAELTALPEGAPVRARPFVLRAADGAWWLIDDAKSKPQATSGAGGAAGTGGEGGSGGEGGDAGAGEGCSCRAAGSRSEAPHGLALALALGTVLAVARRRR
jgi:MYXO-CTERM domain-containing protein